MLLCRSHRLHLQLFLLVCSRSLSVADGLEPQVPLGGNVA